MGTVVPPPARCTKCAAWRDRSDRTGGYRLGLGRRGSLDRPAHRHRPGDRRAGVGELV